MGVPSSSCQTLAPLADRVVYGGVGEDGLKDARQRTPVQGTNSIHVERVRRALPRWRRSSAYHSSAAFHPYPENTIIRCDHFCWHKSVAEGGDALAALKDITVRVLAVGERLITPAARSPGR